MRRLGGKLRVAFDSGGIEDKVAKSPRLPFLERRIARRYAAHKGHSSIYFRTPKAKLCGAYMYRVDQLG